MSDKTFEQLQREEVERQALESAARKLEEQSYGSEAYQKALKTAVKIVRSLKP